MHELHCSVRKENKERHVTWKERIEAEDTLQFWEDSKFRGDYFVQEKRAVFVTFITVITECSGCIICKAVY